MLIDRFMLLASIVALLAGGFSSEVHASRIDIEGLAPGQVLVVNGQHTLTYEDVLVLSARSDSGWHLGWFKNKLGDLPEPAPPQPIPSVVGAPVVQPDLFVSHPPAIVVIGPASGSTNAPSIGGTVAAGGSTASGSTTTGGSTLNSWQPAQSSSTASDPIVPTTSGGTGQSGGGSSAATIPEPAMLLLFGLGAALTARRMTRTR